MPVNIFDEEILTLPDACRALPRVDGKRPHVSTIWRWCREGVRGVRLEYARLGGRLLTSRQALARFAVNVAEADRQAATPAPPASPPEPRPRAVRRSPRTRERQIAEAQRQCQAAGL
jgi:hypothetical protein